MERAWAAKSLEAQRDLLLIQVDTLKARIDIKEMLIANLNAQISDYKNVVSSKSSIIQTMEDQRKILEKQANDLNKQIKREKRRKTFFQITTFVAIGAGVTLLLLK